MGEYRYSRTYKLIDANGQLLKERTFVFEGDVNPKVLKETVKDFTSQAPKQYQRSQNMNQHFMQLNALPVMVNGPWTEQSITEE